MRTELIKKAILEIENPTFETTKQYLEVHSVELDNGKPKVERIDFDSFENVNVVYFPIKNELFFLSVYFSKENNEITYVGTENGNRVYLSVGSENLTYKELCKMTELKPVFGWCKNDFRKDGKTKYNFSRLKFEPIKNEAYDLEAKIKLLLSELEKDSNGVKTLSENAEVYLTVCSNLYIDGNKGIGFDKQTMKRISDLNLGMDIDQYVFGNELKSVL